MNSRNRLLSLAISRQMAPSAKIVAFYIAPDGQVAADSLQFNVDASHLHKVCLCSSILFYHQIICKHYK